MSAPLAFMIASAKVMRIVAPRSRLGQLADELVAVRRARRLVRQVTAAFERGEHQEARRLLPDAERAVTVAQMCRIERWVS